VLAREVDWTRLNYLTPLAGPVLVRLIGTLHLALARLACPNPLTMPLLMRSADWAWRLVFYRWVNWTRLDCVNALS
jgi:hypothetical protein